MQKATPYANWTTGCFFIKPKGSFEKSHATCNLDYGLIFKKSRESFAKRVNQRLR
jgi:hypothetical protein